MDTLCAAGLPVTGNNYLQYVHLDTEPDSIFKVDSVSQHMHVP